MPVETLSRKDRRARQAKAAKIYGIKGAQSLDLHEAYNALARGEVAQAVQLAHPVTQSHPANPHGWIVMGGAALARREGKTAQAFFGQAAGITPRDPVVLAGLAKAHILEAEVEESVAAARRAFEAGSDDTGLAVLYMDLMAQLGRRLAAADLMETVLERLEDAPLCHKLGDMYLDAEESNRAARWYDRAWQLDPAPEAHRIGRLRALLARCDFAEAEVLALGLRDSVADVDTVVGLHLLMLRAQRRYAEAETLAETHEFTSMAAYAQSRGVLANIHQDLGDDAAAEAAYLEAMHVTGEPGRIAKAYGVFRFRDGDYAAGAPYFSQRFPMQQRNRCPLENAAPENLAGLSRVTLMGEQGVGDQLALMALTRLAPFAPDAELVLVSDARLGPLLEGNALGLGHRAQADFMAEPQSLAPNELVYLGDLSRYLEGAAPGATHGGYLRPDPERVAGLRESYRELAEGAPVVGVAWKSASLIGHLRSLPLEELLSAVPAGALVVNLQYGDVSAELEAAALARPDLRFVADSGIDQMADLAGFAAQIAALDTVASIDNTTAHMCGALDHPDAHVLLPAGSECMWYWGRHTEVDPWYGRLALHRQAVAGDWSTPLAELRARLAG